MSGNRKSIRLKSYDYAQQGAYFVTMCVDICRGGSRTALKHNVFGYIKNGKMILNEIGCIIHDSWLWLANQYDYVNLDEFVIMPNHMHGIIFLGDGVAIVQGASRGAPTSGAPTLGAPALGAPTSRKPLGQLIGAFKTVSTKQTNVIRNAPGMRLWQRNYYEHVIRCESGFARVREYIANNAFNWEKDEYYVQG